MVSQSHGGRRDGVSRHDRPARTLQAGYRKRIQLPAFSKNRFWRKHRSLPESCDQHVERSARKPGYALPVSPARIYPPLALAADSRLLQIIVQARDSAIFCRSQTCHRLIIQVDDEGAAWGQFFRHIESLPDNATVTVALTYPLPWNSKT